MNKSLNIICTVLCALLFAGQASAECDFDDFPVMDDMVLADMTGDTLWNNRPMMIKSFQTEASFDSVQGFYHRRWKGEYVDSAIAIWNQITHINDDCMMTVQYAPFEGGGGTYGRLVLSNPPEGGAGSGNNMGQGVPRPFKSQVVSDMQSKDGVKNGRLTMITVDDSVDGVAKFYLTDLPRKGWALERQFQEDKARVLVFRKDAGEMNVLAVPAGDMTQVLINWVEI